MTSDHKNGSRLFFQPRSPHGGPDSGDHMGWVSHKKIPFS